MKTLSGIVVSNKMQKTVIVEIKRDFIHKLYKKAMGRTTRLKVHTENSLQIGEVVEITEIPPMSKEKHYKVSKVLQKTTL